MSQPAILRPREEEEKERINPIVKRYFYAAVFRVLLAYLTKEERWLEEDLMRKFHDKIHVQKGGDWSKNEDFVSARPLFISEILAIWTSGWVLTGSWWERMDVFEWMMYTYWSNNKPALISRWQMKHKKTWHSDKDRGGDDDRSGSDLGIEKRDWKSVMLDRS